MTASHVCFRTHFHIWRPTDGWCTPHVRSNRKRTSSSSAKFWALWGTHLKSPIHGAPSRVSCKSRCAHRASLVRTGFFGLSLLIMGRMDFLPLSSNGETLRLNTEIAEGRTQRARRNPEDIWRRSDLLWNFLLTLCVLCGETVFHPLCWKARAARAKLNAVNR